MIVFIFHVYYYNTFNQMCWIILREKWCRSQLMPMVIKVHYLYQSSSSKIPGQQIPIRFRVDGNQFTTPLISFFLCWTIGCVVWFYKCVFWKTTSYLMSSYIASWGNYIAWLFYMSIITDPNRSTYWSKSSLYCGLWGKHFMLQGQYKQMNC